MLVTLTYTVATDRCPRSSRRWGRSAAPGCAPARAGASCTRTGRTRRQFVEVSQYPTWGEHLRQHGGRLTGADQALYEAAAALATGPPEAKHLFLPRPDPKPADDKERA